MYVFDGSYVDAFQATSYIGYCLVKESGQRKKKKKRNLNKREKIKRRGSDIHYVTTEVATYLSP